jgi:hypothetical protein
MKEVVMARDDMHVFQADYCITDELKDFFGGNRQ